MPYGYVLMISCQPVYFCVLAIISMFNAATTLLMILRFSSLYSHVIFSVVYFTARLPHPTLPHSVVHFTARLSHATQLDQLHSSISVLQPIPYQVNRVCYEQYVTRRVPGRQAVVVLFLENQHMDSSFVRNPGLVLIFAHGID